MLNLIRPKCSETYGIHNLLGLKLLVCLRLGLTHLNDHKLYHNFRDYINPLCSCSLSNEYNFHFFYTAVIFHCKDKPS